MTSEDTIKYPGENATHMKIIGKTHFATIWQDPNDESYEGFNGGTYTFEKGIYTENHKFYSVNSSIGSITHCKVKIEKDRFFMESIAEEGKKPDFSLYEVWKRAE